NVLHQFVRLLKEISEVGGKAEVSSLQMVELQEQSQLLNDFNTTEASYPADKTLIDLFEEQVERHSSNTALVYDGNPFMNYKQLSNASNKLANYLRLKANIQKGDLVGVMLERGQHLIPSIFGILKAGAAYIPIDPHYPLNRVKDIIDSSGLKTILTISEYSNAALLPDDILVSLDSSQNEIENYSSELPDVNLSSRDLAYVIYTSGSTGKPKGVMIEHRSVINRLLWMQEAYPLTTSDVLLQKTPIIFDVSVWEIFWWSLTGSSLCLLKPDAEKVPEEIVKTIDEQQVSVIHFVPSMFSVFLSEIDRDHLRRLKSLKRVFTSGEALKTDQVNQFRDSIHLACGTELTNLYGPTEATVDVSYFDCDLSQTTDLVPIGKPIQNIKLYVLDESQKLTPVGVPGELYIHGDGVARGYLNNKVLTDDRFVVIPAINEGRFYKTGDLVRWMPDGNIEFLGRIDAQVKLRGLRIELGEIETALNNHSMISSSLVLLKNKGEESYLLAYYLSDQPLDKEELREYITDKLPAYMVPYHYVHLTKFPLTKNGKLDRKSLPEPTEVAETIYEAPQSREEILLSNIWTDVLGGDSKGVTEDFFVVGGDSIRSIQISSRVRKEGYDLSVKDILNYRTIREQAQVMKEIKRIPFQGEVTGSCAITPMQYWLLKESGEFTNQAVRTIDFRLDHQIDYQSVLDIFEYLQNHHDGLRTVFEEELGLWKATVKEALMPVSLTEMDFQGKPDHEKDLIQFIKSLKSSFDISSGPLMKLGLYHTDEGSRLLLMVHQLLTDSQSFQVLIEDINTLFYQFENGDSFTLRPKTDSYQFWSKNLVEYHEENSDNLGKENQQAGKKEWEVVDKPEGSNLHKDIVEVAFKLPEDQKELLMGQVHQAYGTEVDDLLFTSLLMSLSKSFGENSLKVDIDQDLRERRIKDEDLTRTVGMFATSHPVVLSNYSTGDYGELIKRVKETLRQIKHNNLDYSLARWGNFIPERSPVLFKSLISEASYTHNLEGFISSGEAKCQYNPNTPFSYEWVIESTVKGGEIYIKILYSRERYEAAKIIEFASYFRNCIANLLQYCSNKTGKELTPSDVTHPFIDISELNKLQNKTELEDVYPLSPMQEGILFHVLSDPESDGYFEQINYKVKGELSLDLISRSIEFLISRHSVLRTSFHWEGHTRPLQVVLPSRKINIKYEDVRLQITGKDSEREFLEQKKNEDKVVKFDLRKDVLMRLSVYRIAEEEYLFIWSHHHIILDGWCMGILVQEFNQIYRSLTQGKDPELTLSKPYSTYISWQNSRDHNKGKNHWKNYLDGYDGLTGLPQKYKPEIADRKYELRHKEFIMSSDEMNGLKRLSSQNGVTVNTIFQMVWGLLLGKYNFKDDVVFGQVVSGRPVEIEGIENMLGVFINTVPVRIRYEGTERIAPLLKRLQKEALDNEPFHYNSLAEVQAQSSRSGQLFDHIMIFENYPMADVIESNSLGDYQISDVEVFEQTNYDLLVMVMPLEQLHVRITYNHNRYEKKLIKRVSDHFKTLLAGISTKDGDASLSRISMLNKADRKSLLIDFNATSTVYPEHSGILDLFSKRVASNGDSVALLFESGESLSYLALDEKSNRIGHYLQDACGIKHGDLVGLMLGKGTELVPYILGILKTGAAYVPIDPDYPEERVKAILSGSGMSCLVSESRYAPADLEISVVIVEKVSDELSSYSTAPLEETISSSDLAYIIYTSGSTGKPKGVMIEHGSLLNYVNWSAGHYLGSARQSFALYSSISFDLTITSIFVPLSTGNRIVVYGKEQDGQGTLIGKVFNDDLSDVIKLTPSHLKIVRELVTDPSSLGAKKLIVGGEQLTTSVASDIHDLFNGEVEIYNEYGPTESTVGCIVHRYEAGTTSVNVPIGLPIANVRAYVLDSSLNPVPMGVPGELYLGGAGLARGYRSDSQQTASRFVPVASVGEERLYRTGDVCRWLSVGTMEYLGRVDDQVKLNGYRIELAEIESVLSGYEGVSGSAVLIRYRGEDAYLAAYYESEEDLSPEGMRSHLSGHLPSYMVPHHYIRLSSLPLTGNGKLDKKALPEPEVASGSAYVAPQGAEEEMLSEIWTSVLGGEDQGANADFFLVGGDSIRSIQISSRLRELGYELSIKDIFNHRTVRDQAKVLKKLSRTSYQGEVTGSGELSPIQRWFVEGHSGDRNHYHQSVLLHFADGTDRSEVFEVFSKLKDHHDVLRTVFSEGSEGWTATVEGYDHPLSIEEKDLRGEDDQEAALQRAGSVLKGSVRIGEGPLMKLGIYHVSEGSYLLIVLHHLVTDGVSWRILFEDIDRLYAQHRSGGQLSLPMKTDAYQMWSGYLASYRESYTYRKAVSYWQGRTVGEESWQLADDDSGSNRYADITYTGFNLEPELTSRLLGEAHGVYGTQVTDLLLASLLLALSKGYSEEQVQIDLEGHGREPLGQGEQIGRTVGWFTTIYPVMLHNGGGKDAGRLIKEVKESLHQVPNNGLDYLLYSQQEAVGETGSPILFNYLGQFDS
ncbi:MAG: amino acid adenylation domain-containing protein, partial [Cyclobacteriaceae bacterium]